MKHKLNYILLAFAAAALISGCGKKQVTESSAPETTAAVKETVAEKEVTKSVKPEEENNLLENNGHYFVKYGDRVYYRVSSVNDLQNIPGLFAEYMSNSVETDCAIAYYDLKDHSTGILFADCGYGPLYIQNGGLWVNTTHDQYKSRAIKYSLEDGSILDEYDEYRIEGVDTANDAICISTYDNGAILYVITKDKKVKIDAVDTVSFSGMDGGKVFYRTGSYSSDEPLKLNVFDIKTGKSIVLGDIPENEFETSGTLEQVQVIDDKAYISFGMYEGTALFFDGAYYMSADLNKAGSLKTEMEISGAEEIIKTPTFKVENGKMSVKCKDHNDGLNHADQDNASLFITSDCKEHLLVSAYDACKTAQGCPNNIEIAEEIGDYIFYYDNFNIDSPEDSVGWRDAYRRGMQSVRVLDTRNNENTIIGFAQNPVMVEGDVDQSNLSDSITAISTRAANLSAWKCGTYVGDDKQLIYVKAQDDRFVIIDYTAVSEDGVIQDSAIIQLDTPESGTSISDHDFGVKYSINDGVITVDQSVWGGGFREGEYKKQWEQWQMDEETGNFLYYDIAGELGTDTVSYDGWVTNSKGEWDPYMGMYPVIPGTYQTIWDTQAEIAQETWFFNIYTNISEEEYRLKDDADRREVGTVSYFATGQSGDDIIENENLRLVNTVDGYEIVDVEAHNIFGYLYPAANSGILMFQPYTGNKYHILNLIYDYNS